MAQGYAYACSNCDFEFWSGHSHHTGASHAVCMQCLAQYCLPTRNVMGPGYDELIELHETSMEPVEQHRRGRKKHKREPQFSEVRKPTGQHILTEKAQPWGVHYRFVENLKCTRCGSVGTIVTKFEKGGACPACKSGVLSAEDVDY